VKYFREAYLEIAEYIRKAIDVIDLKSVEKFIEILLETNSRGGKVMVVGVGRSGLVGRAFAMRLMHLGLNSYVLGETITPSISEGDLLVAISGSGTTQLVVAVAEAAKRMRAIVVAITSHPDSPLGSIADLVIKVPGRTKVARIDDYFARQILGIHEPLAPLGTLFEDTTMVFLDSVVAELMVRLGKNEHELKRRHANIELP